MKPLHTLLTLYMFFILLSCKEKPSDLEKNISQLQNIKSEIEIADELLNQPTFNLNGLQENSFIKEILLKIDLSMFDQKIFKERSSVIENKNQLHCGYSLNTNFINEESLNLKLYLGIQKFYQMRNRVLLFLQKKFIHSILHQLQKVINLL